MLPQLFTSKPLAPKKKSKTNAVVLSDESKAFLDEEVAKRVKAGWKLRYRAFSADGQHSASLFKPAE
jgi:hypothetical protein